ncbi:MAG TPA: sigma factor-like helix-turn-helix DNA-binding protein, partial [Gaiellales bacterium]|nr:sigma factor-like helix-turn-helix DNA-binding protein [Gaiellales bacterium]
YGFDGAPQTLQAVGSELHLTAERVRQIQHHALETLRAAGSTVLSQIVAEYAEAEALDSEADRLGA